MATIKLAEDADHGPPSPMFTKVVNVISGESSLCGTTYSAIKRRERKSVLEGPYLEPSLARGHNHFQWQRPKGFSWPAL